MIFYLILVISFFLIALIVREKRFVFCTLAENSVAVVNHLMSDIEEEEKLKHVQKSTNKLVGSLFRLLWVFILAGIAGSIPVVIYCVATHTDYHSLVFSSFYSILFISIGATIPFVIPFGKKQPSGYSEPSQLLHRMALNNYYISNKLFKREVKKLKKRGLERRPDFVIISGLARAGTTSLMNDLSKIDDFVSLNYANMPFVMSPNTWAKFYKPKNKEVKERSHKDGIMIGLDSNEALEEYFFKVKANDAYIYDSHLSEYSISKKDYEDYLDYQCIIKKDNKKIYLAKNNNFMLRYKSVRELNEDFVMVILYRDPLTHASSLMEKHKEYQEQQTEDPFVLEYMNWLCHHEFGLNQKPFMFSGSVDIDSDNKASLDYWLRIWINYYSYVLTIEHSKTLLVNYDSFCENPKEIIRIILNKIGISANLPEYPLFTNKRKVSYNPSPQINNQALKIYDQLKKRGEG